MNLSTKAKAVGGAVGLGVGALGAWTVASAVASRGVERVPYTVVGDREGVELRRYPETVRVRTTAPSTRTAFRRLFRYIAGANEGGAEVSMTAPVETGEDAGESGGEGVGDEQGAKIEMTAPVETVDADRGESISMTAPVETDEGDGGVTMSFFLPSSYTPETAPEPTSDAVELVVDPPKTMAALAFSWWTPGFRVRRKERELLGVLDDAGIDAVGDPVLRRYDAPFVPPFRRTNEVLVEVDSASVRRALHE